MPCFLYVGGILMPQLIDLAGSRYGRLKVIERTDNHVFPCGVSHTVWKCRCDCGTLTTASTNDLRTGHKKSCGCQKYEFSHSKGRPWNRKHNTYTIFTDHVQGHSDTGNFIFDIDDFDRVKSHYWSVFVNREVKQKGSKKVSTCQHR